MEMFRLPRKRVSHNSTVSVFWLCHLCMLLNPTFFSLLLSRSLPIKFSDYFLPLRCMKSEGWCCSLSTRAVLHVREPVHILADPRLIQLPANGLSKTVQDGLRVGSLSSMWGTSEKLLGLACHSPVLCGPQRPEPADEKSSSSSILAYFFSSI